MTKVPVVIAEDKAVETEPVVLEESSMALNTPKKPLFSPQRLIIVAFTAVVFGLIILMVALLQDRSQLQDQVNHLSASTDKKTDETQQLVEQLGKYIELPTDEAPTLATVTNVESLKDQQFFKNAQNGDKVLLYAKAGRALLYRPSSQKVVDISTLAVQGSDAATKTN